MFNTARIGAMCAAILVLVPPALAAYPEKAIRIIVPFAPGGNIDINARMVAPGLSQILGQQVIVENRGGAGGRTGTVLVAKSPPDGYTLLLGASGTLTVQPAFTDNPGYDPIRDFAYTSLISIVPMVVVSHPSLPVRNIRELIALARSRPGELLMGSAGTGSNTHLTGELFQSMAKVKFLHVPFKGSGASLIDLVGGQVHLMFDQLSSSASHIQAGKLRALAVTTQQQSAFLPGVPTVDQSGVPGFESSTYTGIALPRATSPEIVNRLREALIKVLDLPAVREGFSKLGSEVIKSTPEEFARRVEADGIKWRRVRKETGIKVQ